jgi:beta-phosphoglucomutase
MKVNFDAWKHAFSKYAEISPEDYYPLEGCNLITVAEKISTKYNLRNINYEDLVTQKDAYYISHHKFELYPDVIEVITTLVRKKIPIAIVTAARKNRIHQTVPESFLHLFTTIITGDDIKCKPDPEIYLKAAKELSVKPSECIVIENSPLGVSSAKSAGMFCIAITNTVEMRTLCKADRIVKSFDDISILLQKVFKQ